MRLVMCLLVRDEADVIRENLEFHFSQGVDFAIVMDNRSRDGTSQILRDYERGGLVRRIDQPGVYDQGPWLTQMARMAVAQERADWVLPNDGDEFWLPRAGTLKEILEEVPPEVGALVCPRVTFVPTPDDGRPWWERMTLRQRVSVNELGKPLRPKVVHRAAPGLHVRKGNHRRVPGAPGETREFDGIEALHFQMRSYEQFERGVVLRGRTLKRASRRDQRFNRVRRGEFETWRDGGLEDYYAKRVFSEPGAELVRDERLRDHLDALEPLVRRPSRTAATARAAARSAVSSAREAPRAAAVRFARWRQAQAPLAPFVVGVPRSGTTLVRLMLDAHPELAIPAETHFTPDVIGHWRELRAAGVPRAERVEPCIELIISHRRWADLGLDEAELRAHLGGLRRPVLSDVARAVNLLHAQRERKPRWGEKTPGYMMKMRRLRKVMPEARFVHVIRDGRDVALSLAEVSWGTQDTALAARRWKRRIRTARQHARRLPEGSYLEIRYEDLISDPEPVLRRVADFVELPWDGAMLAYRERAPERMASIARDVEMPGGGVLTATERRTQHALVAAPLERARAGRWRTEMEPAAQERFGEIAGDLLAELGYG